MKNRFAFNSENDVRIECFTNLDTSNFNQDMIALRTGKFKISRNDTDKGKRYFISDHRETVEDSNAVVVFCPEKLELIKGHDILPIYDRDDVSVFATGVYNHPQIKKRLTITTSDIREDILKT